MTRLFAPINTALSTNLLASLLTSARMGIIVSLFLGLSISAFSSGAIAQPETTSSEPTAVAVQPTVDTESILEPFIAPALIGNWSGMALHIGEYGMVQWTLSIQENGQGTWQIIGAQYNVETRLWEPQVLEQGTLTTTQQDSRIFLHLEGERQSWVLNATFQNNQTALSGEAADVISMFRFERSDSNLH